MSIPTAPRKPPLLLLLPVLAGVFLHTYTALFVAEGGMSAFLVGLFLWSCLPYAIAGVLPFFRIRPGIAAGYAFGALLGDLFMHYSAFINPKGSTAALGLLFMPMWNLALLGPIGAVVAWVIHRRLAGKRRNSA